MVRIFSAGTLTENEIRRLLQAVDSIPKLGLKQSANYFHTHMLVVENLDESRPTPHACIEIKGAIGIWDSTLIAIANHLVTYGQVFLTNGLGRTICRSQGERFSEHALSKR